MKSIRLPVLNSLIFIRDTSLKELPQIDGLSAYWRTRSSVAVSCLPDSEGETAVTIGAGSEVAQNSDPLFDLRIETPSKVVVVETVRAKVIFEATVTGQQTRLRVWTNGHPATDRIVIALN